MANHSRQLNVAEGLLKDGRRQPGSAPLLPKTGIMKELTKIIVAGVSTAALAGGIGAGLAYADTPTDEPTSTPTATATTSPTEETPAAEPGGKRDQNGFRKRAVRRQLRFVARALHGEVTLAGEKHRVIAFQRGGVQKVSRTSLTVKSNDGFVETYVLSDDTKVRENGDKSKLSDIDTSDRVLVVATKDDSTLDARRVIVRDE
jgi:hypothetical protein